MTGVLCTVYGAQVYFFQYDTLRYFYTVLEIFGKASVWLSTIELVFQSVFNVK